ncbi:hypothetical protein DFH27DRAFT_524805 [Peziza echinospora]|nr:hypothetical protein DFH27DRAFT_524805 [Peziza echinospora]
MVMQVLGGGGICETLIGRVSISIPKCKIRRRYDIQKLTVSFEAYEGGKLGQAQKPPETSSSPCASRTKLGVWRKLTEYPIRVSVYLKLPLYQSSQPVSGIYHGALDQCMNTARPRYKDLNVQLNSSTAILELLVMNEAYTPHISQLKQTVARTQRNVMPLKMSLCWARSILYLVSDTMANHLCFYLMYRRILGIFQSIRIPGLEVSNSYKKLILYEQIIET